MDDIGRFHVRNRDGAMVPAVAPWSRGKSTAGPDDTNRFNLIRAAQVLGQAAPGYSSGQAIGGPGAGGQRRACPRT